MSISDTVYHYIQKTKKVDNKSQDIVCFTSVDAELIVAEMQRYGITDDKIEKFVCKYLEDRGDKPQALDTILAAAKRYSYQPYVAEMFKRFSSYFESFRIPKEPSKVTDLFREWVDALERKSINPTTIQENLDNLLSGWTGSFAPTPNQFVDFCENSRVIVNQQFVEFMQRMSFRYKRLWDDSGVFRVFLYNEFVQNNLESVDFKALEIEITKDPRYVDFPPNVSHLITISKSLLIEGCVPPCRAYNVATNPKNELHNNWIIKETRRRIGGFDLRVGEMSKMKARFDSMYAIVLDEVYSGKLTETQANLAPVKQDLPDGDPVKSAEFFANLLNGI
ncbi:hypothetical protein DZF72_26195 [Vibrio parahaemolyticus]|nr:hypothetical protein [Vibrio parahaemolyticus]